MKTQINKFYAPASEETAAQFNTVIGQSMVAASGHQSSKVFSAADMWNIDRRKRTRTQRRYF